MPLGVDALLAASAAIASRIGGIVGVAELRNATRMPAEALNSALEELETSGWITRVGKSELFVPHESIPPYIRYIL
jgi:DNA-binding HxlR family transcriptional regulator